jgi:O-antigen/teichoic acid export membrane protein
MVQFFEDTKTFAIFSVGAIEIPIFAMLSASFSQKIYPDLVKLISNEKNDEAKKLWINTTIKVSYITYPMIAILMFFSKEIIFLIYKQDYSQSIPLFKTFLLIGLFRNNYYGALITASGKSTIIFKYSIFTLLLNSILSLVFYYFFGIKGIIYGNLIATLAINYLQLRSEKLIHLYLNEFILNPKIIILISLIICIYVIH